MYNAAGSSPEKKPKILVAPLDWGLGHTTRCIPLIQNLLAENCEVIIAGNEQQKILLQKEFPQLRFLDLPGYNVHYSKKRSHLLVRIVLQIPAISKKVREERNWLKQIVATQQIDAAISDNRYGLYHPDIPCIFITHQLLIKTGLGHWADQWLQKINYRFISRFKECWVPDDEQYALAGNLSHPQKKPKIPVYFIGVLSRFKKSIEDTGSFLLILLSGPEPQRTLFEERLVEELKNFKDRVIFLRGLPGMEKQLTPFNNIVFYNHLPAKELNILMQQATVIISRCGYSTVMDLAVLQAKAILVPTPGQTEQEYLAKYLHHKKFAFCIEQSSFSITESLKNAAAFSYRHYHFHPDLLQKKVSAFVNQLR